MFRPRTISFIWPAIWRAILAPGPFGFLASPMLSGYMTGQNIDVNDGHFMP